MKTETYKCNLCRQETEKNKLFSYYWKSAKVPQGYILTDDIQGSDVHICYKCIDYLKEAFNNSKI
jgi:hypothetical protein